MKILRPALIVLTGFAGQLALAHTELLESVPADHSMLETAPAEVALQFSEPVRLTALAVHGDGDAEQALGPLPTEPTAHFTVATPMLGDGHYTVSWRALSEDTHVMSGEFMFMVGSVGEYAQGAGHTDTADAVHAEHNEHEGAH